MSIPSITFYADDILVQAFLRRYLDKARRMEGYQNQVKFIESKIKEFSDYMNQPLVNQKYAIPNPYADTVATLLEEEGFNYICIGCMYYKPIEVHHPYGDTITTEIIDNCMIADNSVEGSCIRLLSK